MAHSNITKHQARNLKKRVGREKERSDIPDTLPRKKQSEGESEERRREKKKKPLQGKGGNKQI